MKPENSLVCQSRDAGYHPGVIDKSNSRNILVNGDGFGVAFYGTEPSSGSCLFKVVSPAWSNKNLINLGQYIHSSLVFGHIRAATNDRDIFEPNSVSNENCHPFKYDRWTFMHNGGIPHFSKIKLSLLNLLRDEYFQMISGSTDSEHIFALFMSLLPINEKDRDIEAIAATMDRTIETVIQLCLKVGITEPCSLNLCVTDGTNIVATRFRNGKCSPPSLYYCYGVNFSAETGTFTEPGTEDSCEIVISSAPLGKQNYCEFYDPCNDNQDPDFDTWLLIPKNSMLLVIGCPDNISQVNKISIRPIEALVTKLAPNYEQTIKDEMSLSLSPSPRRLSRTHSEAAVNTIFPSSNPSTRSSTITHVPTTPAASYTTSSEKCVNGSNSMAQQIVAKTECFFSSFIYRSDCKPKQIYPNGKCASRLSPTLCGDAHKVSPLKLPFIGKRTVDFDSLGQGQGLNERVLSRGCNQARRADDVSVRLLTRERRDSDCYDVKPTKSVCGESDGYEPHLRADTCSISTESPHSGDICGGSDRALHLDNCEEEIEARVRKALLCSEHSQLSTTFPKDSLNYSFRSVEGYSLLSSSSSHHQSRFGPLTLQPPRSPITNRKPAATISSTITEQRVFGKILYFFEHNGWNVFFSSLLLYIAYSIKRDGFPA